MISNFQSSHSLWGENSVERVTVVVRNPITSCGGKWNRNVILNIWWGNKWILSKPKFPSFFLSFWWQNITFPFKQIFYFKQSKYGLYYFYNLFKKVILIWNILLYVNFFVMANIKSEISSSSFVFKPFRSVMIPPYNRHKNQSKKEADMNHKVGGLQFYIFSVSPSFIF